MNYIIKRTNYSNWIIVAQDDAQTHTILLQGGFHTHLEAVKWGRRVGIDFTVKNNFIVPCSQPTLVQP